MPGMRRSARNRSARRAVQCGESLVAGPRLPRTPHDRPRLQEVPEGQPDASLVVDDEDPQARRSAPIPSGTRTRNSAPPRAHRRPGLPARFRRDSSHDRETELRATAKAVERLEDSLALRTRYARPLIGHREQGRAVVRRAARSIRLPEGECSRALRSKLRTRLRESIARGVDLDVAGVGATST